ncbi:MAG TPA: multiheme c-type cytochrome, partial [Aggregatilineales bacterium]|nr:multiheme c-type cytochrome [Aggregatilineales bacterium]
MTAGLALAADDTAPPMQDDGEGDDRGEFSECAECHPDVTAAWQDGPHDTAFSIEHFQHSWTELNQPQECLACHTTGFSPATGNYQAEGVTCEACHGEVPDGHPPRPVDLNRANQVCAECHTVTQAEFRASAHSEKGLACTTCHYAHDNGLRADTEVAQCLACHGDELDGFVAHTTHLDNGLSCRDCHG